MTFLFKEPAIILTFLLTSSIGLLFATARLKSFLYHNRRNQQPMSASALTAPHHDRMSAERKDPFSEVSAQQAHVEILNLEGHCPGYCGFECSTPSKQRAPNCYLREQQFCDLQKFLSPSQLKVPKTPKKDFHD